MVEISGYLAEIGVSVRRNASDPDGVSIETRDGHVWWQGDAALTLPGSEVKQGYPCVFDAARDVALICLFNDRRPDQLSLPRAFVLSEAGRNYAVAPMLSISRFRADEEPKRTEVHWQFAADFDRRKIPTGLWPKEMKPAPRVPDSKLAGLVGIVAEALCLFGEYGAGIRWIDKSRCCASCDGHSICGADLV